jgi:TRAP-type C4-dicarboxylate transport system permease small subunit
MLERTKTIANILNALIIIIIAVFTAYTSWKIMKREDINNKEIENIKKKLNAINNKLRI